MSHKPLTSRVICKGKPTHPPGAHGDLPSPLWPWRAQGVGGEVPPSLWFEPAASGSHQCHHSPLHSVTPLHPIRRKYIKHLSENNISTTPPSLQKPGIWVFARSYFFAVLRFSLSSLPGVFYNFFLALSSQTYKGNCLHVPRPHWSPPSWMTASAARFPADSSAKQAVTLWHG